MESKSPMPAKKHLRPVGISITALLGEVSAHKVPKISTVRSREVIEILYNNSYLSSCEDFKVMAS
jgi:hypothetical protein